MKSFTLKCSINVNEKIEYLLYYFRFPIISNIVLGVLKEM